MPIYDSSMDYGTGTILILWDGDKPTSEEFREYAEKLYGVIGHLEIEDPINFRGMQNPGTATITSLHKNENKEREKST